MNSIIPELLVEDLEKTLSFYTKVLGFKTVMSFPEKHPYFALLKQGKVEIMLYHRTQFSEEIPKFTNINMGGSLALFIKIDKIKQYYTKLKNKAEIIQPLHKTDYDTQEFSIHDVNGYVLIFSEETS